MRTSDLARVTELLHSTGDLSEALLTDLTLENFGYSVRADFDRVIDADGALLDLPLRLTLLFEAVESMTLVGGLTVRMVEHPEEINWGLSEVSLVRITPEESGVHAEIRWERERRIEITCARVTLEASGAEEAST